MTARSRKIRALALLPALVVAGLALTGCDSKVGAAAVVDGAKISESDVSSQVAKDAKDVSQARGFVLNYLIRQQVLTSALDAHGGVPDDRTLDKYHDSAVSGLLGQQLSGSDGDKALGQAVAQFGAKPGFAPVVLQGMELEFVLADKLDVSTEADLVSKIGEQNVHVSVNPRYGGWDASQLGVTGFSTKQVPSNVSFAEPFPSSSAQS